MNDYITKYNKNIWLKELSTENLKDKDVRK